MITCSDFNNKSQDVRHWSIASLGPVTALQHGRYIEIYYLPGTTNQKDSEQMSPPLTSDLGLEENLEMSLNTFSGYDLGIVDFAQIGATAERARTTSRLTSTSPGPATNCNLGCSSRRNGQLHNGGDRGRGQGDSVGRLLGSLEDLGKAAAGSGSTPTSQEHLVLLLKFRYLVLVIYAMFSIVQSCLVFGRGM